MASRRRCGADVDPINLMTEVIFVATGAMEPLPMRHCAWRRGV